MSDVSKGPGWWLASNGKWYPPETHPDAAPPTLPTPPTPTAATRPMAPGPSATAPVTPPTSGPSASPGSSAPPGASIPPRPSEPPRPPGTPAGMAAPAEPTLLPQESYPTPVAETPIPPVGSTSTTDDLPPGADPISTESSNSRLVLFGGLALAAAIIGVTAWFLTRGGDEVSDDVPATTAASTTTTTATPATTTTAVATTVAAPVTVAPAPVNMTCGGRLGWTAEVGWPGEIEGLASYQVTATINGLTVYSEEWFSEADTPGLIYGLVSGATLTVMNDARGPSGESLGVASSDVAVPAQVCE